MAFNSISVVCYDDPVFDELEIYEDSTGSSPDYLTVTGETFTLDPNEWLETKVNEACIKAYRAYEDGTGFRVEKIYELKMYYCQLDEAELVTSSFTYQINSKSSFRLDLSPISPECFNSLVKD